MSLHDALAGMRSIGQWFMWRLEWDSEEAKYAKTPCALDGTVFRIDAGDPKNWHSYETVTARVAALNASPDMALRYALGFWLTEQCGYWFFDLDGVSEGDGVLTPVAMGMVDNFRGALCEWSSSRRGIHIIGNARFEIAPHSTRPTADQRKAGFNWEFYTNGRGIAFGLDGQAEGSADTYHDEMLDSLIANYFAPREYAEGNSERRAEWRGPEDDDELIRRALNAKRSADSVFGGKLSFEQLWKGENIPEKGHTEADMALACHLAFWTGCDGDRIERLMWKSGLVRAKWKTHRTYLREITIDNACGMTKTVYVEAERSNAKALAANYGSVPALAASGDGVPQRITDEQYKQVEGLLDLVSQCGTLQDMHNLVLPAIESAGVPPAIAERIVKAVNKKLEIWDAKMPVARLRAQICPAMVRVGPGSAEQPEWAKAHCFVKDGDFFYNTENGAQLSITGFQFEFSRFMPIKDNGARENPMDWFFNKWNGRMVHHIGYRPDKEAFFTWDGFDYANSYSLNSVPEAVSNYTAAGYAGIAAFQQHLWDMCNHRTPVFNALMGFLSQNVKHPGKKIRWAPIIKGVHGDGKSLIAEVMRAAMGFRNVGVTGNPTLTNNGGFTDWAVGVALNVMEEIHVTGKERYKLYNATKEFITNNVVSINAKGGKTYNTFNTTNHLAFTNQNDGLPLEKTERRWMVIFTPWASLAELQKYCGLDAAGWVARTQAIDYAYKNCAGEFRNWLLKWEIDSGVNFDSSALITPEFYQMMATSQEDSEAIAAQIIMDGAHGVTNNVLSSACLSKVMKVMSLASGSELPRTAALNHMLTRLGYSKYPKMVKWDGSMHTIWVRNGQTYNPDELRIELSGKRIEVQG